MHGGKMKEKVPMKSTKKLHHRRNILIIILSLFLIAIGIFYLSFDIQKVNVIDSTYYTDEEIKAKVTDDALFHNSFLLYLKYKFTKAKEIPFIQDIEIEMLNRHTINLTVYEKVTTGCVEYMSEYVYFDKDGIVLEITKEKKEKIPQIIGIQYSAMSLHDKLVVSDEAEEEIFGTILKLSQLLKKYKVPIDNVKFDVKGNITLTSGKIVILLGKREVYDEQIAELSGVLQVSTGLQGELDLTDFKAGQDNIIFKVE